MGNTITLLLSSIVLTACVSNQSVRTIQARDYELNCEQLQFELADLGADFEDAKDDSGVTGRNVGLALVFWPGIIVNEVRANKNQDSIDDRIEHLTALYVDKCVGNSTAN
ncbi:MAG: hypothetical protein WDZ52_15340 [Pseudohongiellaceae bacterium]